MLVILHLGKPVPDGEGFGAHPQLENNAKETKN